MTGRAMLMVAAMAAEPARILAVWIEPAGGGQVLTVLTAGDPGEVTASREDGEVAIALRASAPLDLALPSASPPIEGFRLERREEGVVLRVRVAAEVPYRVQRNQAALVVAFGAPSPAPAAERKPPPSVADLYKLLWPAPAEAGGQFVGAPQQPEGPKTAEPEKGGLGLGRLRLNPSASATYVDAQASLGTTPQPVSDRYLEMAPQIAAVLAIGKGGLNAQYGVRVRRGSSFAVVKENSQSVNAGLELGLGPNLDLRVSEHFARGALEANEVDPGGEFFFNLGRFTRNSVSGGVRIRTGARLDVDLGGTWNTVHVAQGVGFFSYESQGATASFGYEATPNLRVALAYGYEHVPGSTERPEAESRAHSLGVQLTGDILPLLTGEIDVGYRDQRSPKAGAGGTGYRGLEATVRLSQQFTRGARLSLSGGRSTPLSAFERNAFYVASSVEGDLTLPLPLSISARGGSGYHWNDYRTVAVGLDEPRKDRIFGWSVGLGRPVTRFAFLRVDYRKDRRTSNLGAFAVRTRSLTVQLGVSPFAPRGAR